MGCFDAAKKNNGVNLQDLIDSEYRKNVFRTDDQRMAAFYFSDENQLKQKNSNGCSGGCFKKTPVEPLVETKPYFEDGKAGCFNKGNHHFTDEEYDNLVAKMVTAENFKQKALEALLVDESEVNEIEPIHFGYSIFEDAKTRVGTDLYFRTSGWQETWIFFSKTSLLAYQCEFYTDNNSKTETTYEYQYKDITSVKVIENVKEEIDSVGQHFSKSCKFVINVPGDSLSCSFNNNEEQINSVKGMKSIIRDKKNN